VPSTDTERSDLKASPDPNRWIEDIWPNEGVRQWTIGDEPKEGPVTLATTKHQAVFSYLRPNFKGITPNASSIRDILEQTAKTAVASSTSTQIIEDIDRMQFANVLGPPGTTTPFYRAEPIIAHLALPHARASVIYVFGGKSPLSSPELRSAKSERTGVGIGDSGGALVGQVKQVVLPKAGHLVPWRMFMVVPMLHPPGLVVLLSDGAMEAG
jgi:hypothetical protein